MMTPFFVVVAAILAWTSIALWRRQRALRREAFIRDYILPIGLFERLRKHHPQLSLKDCQLVANGLRQFFLAYLKSGRKYVSMPSQVVDDLWHEFILYTKHYEVFCRQAFGGFLHHTPAAVLGTERRSNAGLRRCWWFSCLADNINPRRPTRLPLLFALDKKLAIAGGFFYVTDCMALRLANSGATVIHCGGDFGSSGFDGGTDGFGDSSSSSGDGGSDGASSCGGGSCGGGGCGGGE